MSTSMGLSPPGGKKIRHLVEGGIGLLRERLDHRGAEGRIAEGVPPGRDERRLRLRELGARDLLLVATPGPRPLHLVVAANDRRHPEEAAGRHQEHHRRPERTPGGLHQPQQALAARAGVGGRDHHADQRRHRSLHRQRLRRHVPVRPGQVQLQEPRRVQILGARQLVAELHEQDGQRRRRGPGERAQVAQEHPQHQALEDQQHVDAQRHQQQVRVELGRQRVARDDVQDGRLDRANGRIDR
ncbi:MAG: hypothetical protein QM765_39780 [Myxococcales bacterium]